MPVIEDFDAHWDHVPSRLLQKKAVASLEEGKVLHFPELSFPLFPEEKSFCSPDAVDPESKIIMYDFKKDLLQGALCEEERESLHLKNFLRRYALVSRKFVASLIPQYASSLIVAETSLRPLDINPFHKKRGRLHVDASPENPTKGYRLLRLFTNINQHGRPRLWRIGEPFERVVKRFAHKISAPLPGSASLLKFFKMTRQLRTPYDHYMLGMHNKMKQDDIYQSVVEKEETSFAAGSSWLVYTDQVSHAVLSGQHVLEQTFYLPPLSMQDKGTAPLHVLEKHLQRPLL